MKCVVKVFISAANFTTMCQTKFHDILVIMLLWTDNVTTAVHGLVHLSLVESAGLQLHYLLGLLSSLYCINVVVPNLGC